MMDNKERELFIVFSKILPGGGAEKQVLLLAELLAKDGWKVTFLAKKYDAEHLNRYSPSSAVSLSPWKSLLKSRQKLVLSILAPDHTVCLLFALFRWVRWIPFERTHPVFYFQYADTRGPLLLLKRIILITAFKYLPDRILVQTQSSMNFWRNLIGKKKKIFVVPNVFTNSQALISNKSDAQHSSCSPLRILMCGRLTTQKDYPFALRSFAVLQKRFSVSFVVTIFGAGPLQEQLERIIDELKLGSQVHFAGFTQSMMNEYSNHDIYVMTSLVEGLPNTLGEAMATGLPCVTLDFEAGPRDLLGEYPEVHKGQIVNERSEILFAERIFEISKNSSIMYELGQANKARIGQLFSERSAKEAFESSLAIYRSEIS